MPKTHASTRHHTTATRSVHVPTPPTLDTPTGSYEQYEKCLQEAQSIPANQVRVARIDVSVVVINAATGVAAVLARRSDIEALPGVSIAKIESLAGLGQALVYAVGVAHRFTPSPRNTRAALQQARAIRMKLLRRADVLVDDKIFAAADVAAIRKGRGSIDVAEDCVALANLFQRHAASLPPSLVDPADIQTADQLGQRLVLTLHPAKLKRHAAPEDAAAANIRDRIWTLFERTWEQNVWRAGAHLFLREVGAHVPLLLSATRRRQPVAEPPPPVVTPEPAVPGVRVVA